MIPHTLLREEGILLLSPREPLEASDFQELSHEVDPLIAERGKLQGLMIIAKKFPGWRNMAAMRSHMRFARDHRGKVNKVAAVTDNTLLSFIPRLFAPFMGPKFKRFHENERESALAWLRAN